MPLVNILSAKKTKIHGMKSKRWTIQDKISQYKNILRLHNRDKEIISADLEIHKQSIRNNLQTLSDHVKNERLELDNAINGNKQRLRNTLSEHRDLQLAYQNLCPKRIISEVHQRNFNKKKKLDRTNYLVKLKTEKLINLKLELAELEDRIVYEEKISIPVEVERDNTMTKILNARVQFRGANSVRKVYKKILDLLKKDTIYFDVVLAALQEDAVNLGNGLYRITEMGQLASEDLDDRKLQYLTFQRNFTATARIKEECIIEVEETINEINNNVKYLVRHDEITSPMFFRQKPGTESSITFLEREIQAIQSLLEIIQTTAFANTIPDIYPILQTQQFQTERLGKFVQKSLQNRDALLKKAKHAEEVFTLFNYSMVTSTLDYIKQKNLIQKDIGGVTQNQLEIQKQVHHTTTIFTNARITLQSILESLRFIRLDPHRKIYSTTNKNAPREGDAYDFLETDVFKMIPIIITKLKTLDNILQEDTSRSLMRIKTSRPISWDTSLAPKCFEQFVTNMILPTEKKEEKEYTVPKFETKTRNVPTREEIKKISLQIVEMVYRMKKQQGLIE